MSVISEELHRNRMRLLIEYTSKSLLTEYPSPFGAAIYDAEGVLLVQAYDTVMKDCDPTCHGEVNAVRIATKKLQQLSLKGCVLYSTCEPCSMCMSTCIWADIDTVVFGASIKEDASLYWEQPLEVTAEELASRKLTKPRCKVVPHIERRLAQELFKQWQVAMDKLTTQ
jgi:tRNA(Arg) A34 adenosine deaminase TadA